MVASLAHEPDPRSADRTSAGRAEYRRNAMLLGDDILAYLVLALGGALVVGNVLALVRPPRRPGGDPSTGGGDDHTADLPRPPMTRTLVMIGVGLLATVWSIATFAAG